jgi:iron complex outermembrane receptor protein
MKINVQAPRLRRLSPLLAAVIAGLFVQQAVCGEESADATLAEITVTAQKRATSADQTPISITAVTGAELLDRGYSDFSALAASTPGISMHNNGPGQTEFEMRGMTSSGGNSPTVGFYLDDVPLTAPAAAQNGKVVIDPSLYDLDRVEVLRGPQGTLYGSGSMGGTVKLVTNQPNLQALGGSAQTVLSGTDGGGFNHAENAALNLPLVQDKLALRIVVSQSDTSGWIDRIVVGDFPQSPDGGYTRGNVLASPVVADHKDVNSEALQGGRVALAWKPIDNLTITPSIFYQRITQDGESAYDSVPGTLAHYQPFDVAEPYADSVTINSLTVNWKLDSVDLTSVSAYWRRDSSQTQDGSENLQGPLVGLNPIPNPAGSPPTYGDCLPDAPSPFTGPCGTGPIPGTEIDRTTQFSEELRAASSGSGPLQWVGGVFYSQFRSDWDLFVDVTNPAAFGTTIHDIWTYLQPTHIRQEAVFGEGTYAFTDKFNVTVGARWYDYENHVSTSAAGFGSPNGTDTPLVVDVNQSNNGLNSKLGLSYQADNDLLVFANISKGFRPGGGNQPLPTQGAIGAFVASQVAALGYANGVAPLSYGSDAVWSYEIGEKTKLFGNKLRLNSSLYFENWERIQLEELPADYPLFDNANTAHIYGGEVELEAILTNSWTLGASVGLTHAVLAETSHGFQAGDRLPSVPSATGNVNLNYHRPLNDRYKLTARLDTTYTGSRVDLTFPGGVPDTQSPLAAYTLTNLRVGLNAEAGWQVALFANNVTNKRAQLENIAEITFANSAFNRVETNQPRTIGVDLGFRF